MKIEACEGKRRWGVRDGLFEQSGIAAESVDCGRCRLRVAVTAEVVGSERVDRDENDVVARSRNAAAGRDSDDSEDCDEGVSRHGGKAYTTKGGSAMFARIPTATI